MPPDESQIINEERLGDVARAFTRGRYGIMSNSHQANLMAQSLHRRSSQQVETTSMKCILAEFDFCADYVELAPPVYPDDFEVPEEEEI